MKTEIFSHFLTKTLSQWINRSSFTVKKYNLTHIQRRWACAKMTQALKESLALFGPPYSSYQNVKPFLVPLNLWHIYDLGFPHVIVLLGKPLVVAQTRLKINAHTTLHARSVMLGFRVECRSTLVDFESIFLKLIQGLHAWFALIIWNQLLMDFYF